MAEPDPKPNRFFAHRPQPIHRTILRSPAGESYQRQGHSRCSQVESINLCSQTFASGPAEKATPACWHLRSPSPKICNGGPAVSRSSAEWNVSRKVQLAAMKNDKFHFAAPIPVPVPFLPSRCYFIIYQAYYKGSSIQGGTFGILQLQLCNVLATLPWDCRSVWYWKIIAFYEIVP